MMQKKGEILQLLDILACNSDNRPSIQNTTKTFFAKCPIYVKSAFCRILKRWFISSNMGQDVQKLLFLHHNYQVSLKAAENWKDPKR